MDYRILGPLEVAGESGPLAVTGARRRTLLARLVVSANRVVSVDELVDGVWGGRPPPSAVGTVQSYVSQLRKALGAAALVTRPPGYVLVAEADRVDAAHFEALVAAGRVDEALGLWRGPALAEFADADWARAEAARLDELRLGAVEESLRRRVEAGEHAGLVAELETLVSAHRLRERLWALLITVLYRTGRQADALAAYQRLRVTLAEELGIDPSPELRQLEQAVLLQDDQLMLASRPPPTSPTPPPSARRRDAADANKIVASPPTVELVGDDLADRAVIVDLGQRQLRGVRRGGRVLQVESGGLTAGWAQPSLASPSASAWPAPMPPALVRASRRTLIGRRAELDRLARALTGDSSGARVVLVAGEPGVGKTRLAAAAAASAAADGRRVLFGRCDEEMSIPYQPFVEALAAYITAAPNSVLVGQLGSTGGELTRLLPGLARMVPGLGPPTSAAPETERWMLFEATAQFLEAVTAQQRVVLVIDDLQWAEPATLLLLRHLARAAIDGLLIVATARTGGQTPPDAYADAMADLASRQLVDTVTVGGLNGDEVAALVADRLDRPPSKAFAQALQTETGGNAFFVHELVSHLSDVGMLQGSDADWPTAEQVERTGAPEGVRHVLSSRLAHLSPSVREALVVAAVAGGEFNTQELALALGNELDGVITALEEVADRGLIAETAGPAGGYRFAHALVRHTLYERVSMLRRAQLHWRVAEAIRASVGTHASGRLNELAYHYRHGLEAGDPAVALDWLQRAGDQATRQLAFEEAIEHYRTALAALDRSEDDPDRRYQLLAGVAVSAGALSDFAVSRPAWVAAARVARAAGDATRFARAALAYSGTVNVGAPDETAKWLITEGLELAGPGDSVERARLLAWPGESDASLASREQQTRQALAMARRLGDRPTELQVQAGLGWLLLGSSRAEERLAICEGMLAAGQDDDDDSDRAFVYRDLALALIQLGRGQEAEGAIERSEMIARASNRRLALHNALILNAALMIARGAFAEAKPLVAAVRDIGDDRNLAVALGYGAQVSAIRVEQGRAAQVVEGLTDLAEYGPPSTVAWRAMLAGLNAELGRLDQAAEQLDTLAADNFAAVPHDWAFPLAIRYLAETCAWLGDLPRAAQVLVEAEPYQGQLLVVTVGTSIEAAADRSLGQLYSLLGRSDDANQHFESAYELETSLGFVPLAARTRYWHARHLAQTPTADHHRSQALSHLAETQASASTLGMALLEHQADQLRRQLVEPPHDQSTALGLIQP